MSPYMYVYMYTTGQECGCNGRDGCDGVAGATGAPGRDGRDGMMGDPMRCDQCQKLSI